MKCTIPEISWHNREPVLSLHIQPLSEKFYRLATGGADCHVLIWQLTINDNGAVKIDALSDLTRHQRAVNSVRWSPEGQYLATADDDANIIIWQLKTDNIPLLEGETNDKEIWIVHKIMRGHKEDIYDLCWSPNGLKLLSGSIDNTAILWDFTKGKSEHIMTDHKGFVQGVAWDPKNHYIATISTDRVCRIFDSSGKQVKARIQRGLLPVSEEHYLHNKDVKYFHDDTFKSFFRRLDFSPDATLLAVPSGRVEIEDCKKILNATVIFAVDSWTIPIALLPTGKQCSTVVRFCPILFELQDEGPEPIMLLPYRMIIAVGTDHDIILYDTQQLSPFAYFKDIHYTRLTDLTWSSDGLLLVASSTDGYCALISFEENELGIQYVKEESEVEESVMDVSGCEELDKDESVENAKPKKLNLLEQWTIKTPKGKKNDTDASCVNTTNSGFNTDEVILIEDDTEVGKRKREVESKVKEVTKRIKPIQITSGDEKHCATPKAKKRIQPILVEDKKVIEGAKPEAPKMSPLLSFLKTASKEKPKKVDAPTPIVILDENEARDAWKSEKDETKSLENKVVYGDDCTEDFSLHLDDTNSKTVNDESDKKRQNVEDVAEQSKDEVGKLQEEEKCNENPVQIETGTVKAQNVEAGTENAENCIQDKEDTSDKNSVNPEKDLKPSANSEDKVIPKRRIPLITLSSPKHKKK